MGKKILYNSEALFALREGVQKLAKAVKVTMGPKGRNVVIEQNGSPFLTKDGVTVARYFELQDPFENEGASMVREVCFETEKIVGDGTTTSIVLAEALLHQSIKYLTAGTNPQYFNEGLMKGMSIVMDELDKMSQPAQNIETIKTIAKVAANNDSEIAELIGKLYRSNSMLPIVFDESKGVTTEIEIINGTEINSGYVSRDFITDQSTQKCELQNVSVLFTNQKIDSFHKLLPVLVKVADYGKPFAIFAKGFSNDVIATLATNKRNNALEILAVKIPENTSDEFLEDIALVCGTELIDEKKGDMLENTSLDKMGEAKKIISGLSKTTIIGINSHNPQLKKIIDTLSQQVLHSANIKEKTIIEERIARLRGEIAHISLGATTDVEKKEKKTRIMDAYHSALSALEEGVLPGGGVSYVNAILRLNKTDVLHPDEKRGLQALGEALKAPFKTIIENAGQYAGDKLETIIASDDKNIGYNITTNEFENFITSG
ncbi:MAG: chaperonin GroEL, partial [Bacteroidales bacterium]|nr:chaperonin GroEL [Bacteroidales bacterium]